MDNSKQKLANDKCVIFKFCPNEWNAKLYFLYIFCEKYYEPRLKSRYHIQTAKVLAILRFSAVSPEPLLFAQVA